MKLAFHVILAARLAVTEHNSQLNALGQHFFQTHHESWNAEYPETYQMA
jgi:hypothetical protein